MSNERSWSTNVLNYKQTKIRKPECLTLTKSAKFLVMTTSYSNKPPSKAGHFL